MRRNGRLFIILGVGLATLAVLLAVLMFRGGNSTNAVQQAPAPVKIVVAAQDVPPHTVLRDQMLTTETVARDQLKGNEVTSKADVFGMAPRAGLVKGQRVVKADLEVPGITNDIAKGKRAIAVPVDPLNALGGLLQEGDYVDVIFSIKVSLLYVLPTRPIEVDTSTAADKGQTTLPPTAPTDPAAYVYPGEPGSRFKMQSADGKGDPLAKVVLQDVRVLRAMTGATPANQQPTAQGAKQPTAQAANANMVILELTDEQAELVKFILDNGGSFAFTLRAKDDHEKANTAGITFDLLVTNYQLPTPKSVRLPGDKQP